jgi:ribonucleoside-diphosphate reductase alpha chain
MVTENIDKKALDWLENNQLSYDIWNNKYRYNNESFEEWLNRVSNNNKDIKRLIIKKKFLFGGRILANRGIKGKGSMSNCYSRGYIDDSIDAIYDANKDLAKTFKAEGGQGISLSKLRPEGCTIKNLHKSDGIMPFMKVFDTTVGSISQGNSRRGALLMSLDIWHKEASNFIKIKSDLKAINNANLSLEVDDEFMQIVSDYYDNPKQPKPIKHITRNYDGNIVEYDVDVIELYKELCKHACEFAEPGVLFVNNYRNYIIAEKHSEYKIETGNACSEQSLPKHGACNLCSFNLFEYIKNPFTDKATFDVEEFKNDIRTVVRAMDDILDENMDNHPLQAQKDMAYNYRNIGIGYMGLADALIALGMKYGSSNSCNFVEYVTHILFKKSVEYSSELAVERGSFPKYENSILGSRIMTKHFTNDEIFDLNDRGLRNVSLISIAPTGSIATMLNVSSGIEPNFMLKYKRKTISLNNQESVYEVNASIVNKYIKATGNTELPDYFVTAHNIHWKDRIAMQASAQTSCDTAISSTCNLPKGTTPEEVEKMYLLAWKQGLKGFTIYVDGSRDSVLFNDNSTSNKTNKIIRVIPPKRPKELEADFYTIKYKGEQFTVVVGLYEGDPYEIFAYQNNIELNIPNHKGVITKISKNHYSYKSDYLSIKNLLVEFNNVEEKTATLYPSQLLRQGAAPKYIIKTMKKVDDNIGSFTAAICRVLDKYTATETLEEKCPKCGNPLIREAGCKHCSNIECNWSACGD